MPQTHRSCALTQGAQEDFGGTGMGELRPEVVLHQPDVLESHLLRQYRLLDLLAGTPHIRSATARVWETVARILGRTSHLSPLSRPDPLPKGVSGGPHPGARSAGEPAACQHSSYFWGWGDMSPPI
jgi:hypothetical protein